VIGAPRISCRTCEFKGRIEKVAMPYVFRYLAAELAAMNIKVSLTLKEGC
jgi:DNA-directed RNA polymerase I subunit RPA2